MSEKALASLHISNKTPNTVRVITFFGRGAFKRISALYSNKHEFCKLCSQRLRFLMAIEIKIKEIKFLIVS